MERIHPEILTRFNDILMKRKLPFPLPSEYRKWLRYFLDFQAKYPQPGTGPFRSGCSLKTQIKGTDSGAVETGSRGHLALLRFQKTMPVPCQATRLVAHADPTGEDRSIERTSRSPLHHRSGQGLLCYVNRLGRRFRRAELAAQRTVR